jgi:hypothetical protein
MHILHTQETEHGLQVGHLAVGLGTAIGAAARQGDIDRLAMEQAHGALFRVAEGHTVAGDGIDPVLQLHRHAEVVHRDAEHDRVGGLDFGDQRIVEGDARRLFGAALLGRGEQRAERGFIEDRMRRDGKVAQGEAGRGIGRLQARGDGVGDAGRIGGFAAGAGVDLQDVHRALRWVGGGLMRTLLVTKKEQKPTARIRLFQKWNNMNPITC